MFADDTMVFLNGTERQFDLIFDIFINFGFFRDMQSIGTSLKLSTLELVNNGSTPHYRIWVCNDRKYHPILRYNYSNPI